MTKRCRYEREKVRVVPEDSQGRLEWFRRQVDQLMKDKRIGVQWFGNYFISTIDFAGEREYRCDMYFCEVDGFCGWLLWSRLAFQSSDLLCVWIAIDADQQRIWYLKTGRSVPLSELEECPFPEKWIQKSAVIPIMAEIGKLHPVEKLSHWEVNYAVIFDVADKPIVTNGVEFWLASEDEELPSYEIIDQWLGDDRYKGGIEYFLKHFMEEAEPDDEAPTLAIYERNIKIVQQWLRRQQSMNLSIRSD